MECAYCGKKMREGIIPVYTSYLTWVPVEANKPLPKIKFPKGSIKLSKFPKLFREKVKAYYCDTCKHVIMPVQKT